MTSAKEPHLLSGAYALHAVTGEEAAEVEAAMLDSEELRGEVAELSDTAVALGLSVPAETPPPALRSRLLDLIADTPQLGAEASAGPTADAATRPPAEEPATARPEGAHVAPARRSRLRRPSLLLALAAVAVLLFGGGVLVGHVAQAPAAQEQDQAFAQLVSAPDVRRTEAAVAGGGTATVYSSDRLKTSAVVLNGVHPPSGKSLQLWRVSGPTAQSAGLYRPSGGQGYAILPGSIPPGQVVAVTVEPPGGSRQPTTKPIVVVPSAA
jgi:anti-sigma-K factor RskA